MNIPIKSVLISDPVDPSCAKLLRQYGIAVTVKYQMPKEELIAELKNHDGIIVRSETKITADIINETTNLRCIGRAGTGIDNIDVTAATRKGILVLNTPGGNSISACELTCSMITALSRNLTKANQSLKDGRWDRKLYSGIELSGKKLGILGFGRIGREVAKRMKVYGMDIIAFDPLLTEKQAYDHGVTKLELDDVWKQADFITVHTPLTSETKHLLNSITLKKCKKGVFIVNVARGGLIDETALLDSILSGHCAGAGLDVFSEEPPKSEDILKLVKHSNVIATPHLGASTAEAQIRVAVEIAEQFIKISGKSSEFDLLGIVNAPITNMLDDFDDSWIKLGHKLGFVTKRFINRGIKNINVTIPRSVMKIKKIIHSALLVGILSEFTDQTLNLINADIIAKEMGLTVQDNEIFSDDDSMIINISHYTIKGGNENKRCKLFSINEASFPEGVNISDNLCIYQIKKMEELQIIVKEFIVRSLTITKISVSNNWIIIQTREPVTVNIEGINCY